MFTIPSVANSNRGRPRSTERHQAILEATRALLTADGYERLNLEAIAARAGVSKQTIYKWWPSKSAVVTEAVLHDYVSIWGEPLPDTGDIAADMLAWFTTQFSGFDRPDAAALIRALVAASAEDDTHAARLQEKLVEPALEQMTSWLAHGVETGQLRPDANIEIAARAFFGIILVNVLTRSSTGGEDTKPFIDLVLTGMKA